MNNIIKRWCDLELHDTVWQGAAIPGSLLLLEAEIPGSPLVTVWVEVDSDYVHVGKLLEPGDDVQAAMLETLVEMAERHLRYRPSLIEVSDEALYEYLREQLAGSGIEIELVTELSILDAARRDMPSLVGAPKKPTPGPLDGPGVTEAHLERLAEAAGAFLHAAPWQWLTDVDVVEVRALHQPETMHCCTVMGSAALEFGLSLCESLPSYRRREKIILSGDRFATLKDGVVALTLESFDSLPISDHEYWETQPRLTNGDRPFPFAIKFRRQEDDGPPTIERPSGEELAFFEALLRGFAATTEAEIDGARWQQTVDTINGPLTISFSLPDLLTPPTASEWMGRGYGPSPRSQERMFADVARYLDAHPPNSQTEAEATIKRFWHGKSIDFLVTQPETPIEKAQELCFQAFDTHGRRRVHLAREALQVCPDCADAHVILAERGQGLMDRLAHYERAVAAGERALGPDLMQELTGHFWHANETRPYMRARFGLATTLADLGRLDEAIGHFQELLRLNPEDNQGARFFLLPMLLAAGRDADAAPLFEDYDDDSTPWRYGKAIFAFRVNGRGALAERELKAALRCNEYVPEVLRGERDYYAGSHCEPGSEEEAALCVEELQSAFATTPGIIDWIDEVDQKYTRESNRRRLEQRRKERQAKRDRKRRRK